MANPLDKARRTILGSGGDDSMPVYTPGRTSAAADAPKPIGVPEDYTTPFVVTQRPAQTADALAHHAEVGMGQGSVIGRHPIYKDGDQYRPASTDPASIGRLQGSMAAAGLLTDFRYGVWDEASVKAYEQLLGEANAAGITAEAALRNRAQGIEMGGSAGSGRGGGHWEFDENGEPVFVPDPLQVKRTNRDDLVRAIRTGIIDTMGTGWSQQQVGALADLYLQQEEQVQIDAANQTGPVVSSPTMPSPETFVQNELQRRDPTGYQAAGVVQDSLPMFLNAIKGWA